ncbi:aromatic amino acid ammonia-lyase [Flavobacterium agricola]|uniref:Aromatic amino acid ammonia-lyase n=1 Tax=Flavobacterium agricola TaxID=2870839 RepID=A0ABY6M2A7_9FLAO|nr:aromatic amino acid ammonia-lyase [Flavobacterium agricola]UYW01013.1 aromatic amino acid ammonia-lyase [Flavobacterium agricola]
MQSIKAYLSLSDFKSIVFGKEQIILDSEVYQRITASYEFLKQFSSDKIIYGVNTGFGPMAQYRIKQEDQIQLQYNLIRSHCAGIGDVLQPEMIKSAVLARLNTLSLGKSGVNPTVINLMQEFINRDIYPVVYAHGSVGASGDLVQLAHVALALIGEGEVIYKGEIKPTKEVFEIEGLEPMKIEIREGLSILNGTSVMTGVGVVNHEMASKLLHWSVSFSSAINEIVKAHDDHFSATLNNAKLHEGQQKIAEMMRTHLQDSQLIKKRDVDFYSGNNQEEIFKDKVQEYYSIRCVPQILGPVLETLNNVGNVLEREINSANDNPIVSIEEQNVFHGGNFHGDYISLEMDKLKLVITRLTMLAERQLNYLLNSKINEILPPFVNMGKLGFNFGMQGAQFTATSTTAENQTLSTSMYVHSIPNNNDNQDIVSMGTNAAVITNKVITNAFEVLAIQAITIMQAIDILEQKDQVSSETRKIYNQIRQILPAFSDDAILYPSIKKVKEFLMK